MRDSKRQRIDDNPNGSAGRSGQFSGYELARSAVSQGFNIGRIGEAARNVEAQELDEAHLAYFSRGRRFSVSAESFVPSQNFKESYAALPRRPKTPEEMERLRQACGSNLLFKNLEETERTRVLEAMFEVAVAKGDSIIRQGDEGDNFYVVDSGHFSITINMSAAEIAAEQARRPSTGVEAPEEEQQQQSSTSAAEPKKEQSADTDTGSSAAPAVKPAAVPASDGVVVDGSGVEQQQHRKASMANDSFVDNVTGASDDGQRPQKIVAEAVPGDSFGELALMYNTARQATVTATEPSKCWAMDRHTFRTIILGAAYQKRKEYEGFLADVPLLSTLSSQERSKIADAMEPARFPAGSTIVEQDNMGGKDFYIITRGEARVIKTVSTLITNPERRASSATTQRGSADLTSQKSALAGIAEEQDQQPEGDDTVRRPAGGSLSALDEKPEEVNRLRRGDYFGEISLLYDAPRQATVVADTDVECVVLNKASFTRLLGPLSEILQRNMRGYRKLIIDDADEDEDANNSDGDDDDED
eukprot:Clim_evm3s75 gene=Clim_evmTU3s75